MSKVILSAFLDEGVPEEGIKDLPQQLMVGQAVGLKYWTPRFIYNYETKGNLNILKLHDPEIKAVVEASKDYGFKIGCIGTAIGKEKLVDEDDGNKAPYTTPEQSLSNVKRGIEAALMADATFLRAFSFYGVRGETPSNYLSQATDRLGPMVEECTKAKIIYLMEMEAGVVGHNAENSLKICKEINNPYLLVCTDAANSHVQGLNAFEEYKAVAEAGKLGLMHIKDYTNSCAEAIVIDEEALRHFGSVDVGLVGHRRIFEHLKESLPSIDAMLTGLGAPGLILDVEGHMKGGGQFGGWSGPDGLGVAVRALTDTLNAIGIQYVMRKYEDIKKK
ncbi:TIM barrel protein [Candidatus Woesearchaeota archaeon]|nr:TIM barrel protein [Candidatus Woesearchaeota archaeon]